MASRSHPNLPAPRRGEIWTAYLDGAGKQRHWVLVVSLDHRNMSDKAFTVLVVPFASRIVENPTTLVLPPGETGLPGPSCLRGHFITALFKAHLINRTTRSLSGRRMREVCSIIRRAYDPEAPY
ncbi:MAG TPA: type II toxin-antitoxin system PemK/MazF family toxin [Candidatus Acidoferrum sp.]